MLAASLLLLMVPDVGLQVIDGNLCNPAWPNNSMVGDGQYVRAMPGCKVKLTAIGYSSNDILLFDSGVIKRNLPTMLLRNRLPLMGVELVSGTIDVSSETGCSEMSVEGAGITISAEGTHYQVERGKFNGSKDLQTRITVYDGNVSIQGAHQALPVVIKELERYTVPDPIPPGWKPVLKMITSAEREEHRREVHL